MRKTNEEIQRRARFLVNLLPERVSRGHIEMALIVAGSDLELPAYAAPAIPGTAPKGKGGRPKKEQPRNPLAPPQEETPNRLFEFGRRGPGDDADRDLDPSDADLAQLMENQPA